MINAALFDASGSVASNATWNENITFSAGAPMSIAGLTFKMNVRVADEYNAPNDYGWVGARTLPYGTPSLVLSATDGTLTIKTDPVSGVANILSINVPAAKVGGLAGDYIIDLASIDALGKVVLWAHGLVTFSPNPVSFP